MIKCLNRCRDTESRESSQCQPCRHRRHQRLSINNLRRQWRQRCWYTDITVSQFINRSPLDAIIHPWPNHVANQWSMTCINNYITENFSDVVNHRCYKCNVGLQNRCVYILVRNNPNCVLKSVNRATLHPCWIELRKHNIDIHIFYHFWILRWRKYVTRNG